MPYFPIYHSSGFPLTRPGFCHLLHVVFLVFLLGYYSWEYRCFCIFTVSIRLRANGRLRGSQAACPTHVCGLRSPSRPLFSRPEAAAGCPATDSPWWCRRPADSGAETEQIPSKTTKMKVGGAKDLSPSSINCSQLTLRCAADCSRDFVTRTNRSPETITGRKRNVQHWGNDFRQDGVFNHRDICV